MKITDNFHKAFIASVVGLGTISTATEAGAQVQEQLPQPQIVKYQKSPLDKLDDKLYELGIPGPHVPFIVFGIGALIGLFNMTKIGNHPIIEIKQGKE